MTTGSTELSGVRRLLDELDRAVRSAEQHFGGTLEVRRVRLDLNHLRESMELLDAAHIVGGSGQRQPQQMVPLTDAPYDPALWQDAEDEGVGSHSRHHD
jgi:hypothetical protein